MKVSCVAVLMVMMAVAQGGYYKIRAPPPPPPPPATIHYGPKPPPAYYPPYRHRPPAPHHHHHHGPPHHGPHHGPPHRGSGLYKGGGPSRYGYHRPHPPPHPPKAPSFHSWKNYPLRGPAPKEPFSGLHIPSYTPNFLKEDDKGPIHTIPAPNLGPGSAALDHSFYKGHPIYNPHDDLAAFLKHGVRTHTHHSQGYQVTEDTNAHDGQAGAGSASYFAPDPDPHVPSLKVPLTTDPHSVPSNGQVPLDLYLQQHAEKEQQGAVADNTLTAQDLFKLLNYQQGGAGAGSLGLIPQTQLQSHVLQPSVQFYQPATVLMAQPHGQAQLTPHYQTFNYEEQSQEGAYGSDSFPAASMSLGLRAQEAHTSPGNHLEDTDQAGSDKHETYQKPSESDINALKTDTNKVKKHINQGNYQSTFIPSPIANQDLREEKQHEEETSQATSVKPEDKIQLQKSIQIYEKHGQYPDEDRPKDDMTEYNEDYSMKHTKLKGSQSEEEPEEDSMKNDNEEEEEQLVTQDSLPFGTRIRPKRF